MYCEQRVMVPRGNVMEWWVARTDRRTVGPVSTELLLLGIGAGRVPTDALICEVGGTTWKPVRDVAPFSIALGDRRARRRLDSWDDAMQTDARTRRELDSLDLDDAEVIDENDDERTIVDARPFGAEPPTGY